MTDAKPYSYNCVDESILLPHFKKHYVEHIYKLVPKKLTANFITLISSCLMWIMFYFCFHGNLSPVVKALVFIFCVHGYVVGDHLDGMQAKNTKTSSPLGEFLDHYFDIFNGTISVIGFCALVEISNPLIVFVLTWVCNIGFAATIAEEHERKELFFGPVGTLEGIAVSLIFYASWMFPAVREFWQTPLYGEFPRYWLIIGGTALGFFYTVYDIIKRLGYSPLQLNLYLMVSSLLVLVLHQMNISMFWGWWALTFFSADYVGMVMGYYLRDKKHPSPDLITCVAIIGLAVVNYLELFSTELRTQVFTALMVYMAAKMIWGFLSNFNAMKQHWLWLNP